MRLLKNDYITSPYQAGQWILEVSGAHFIINDDTKKLIDLLSTYQNYKEASERFNSDFDNTLNEKEFVDFIEKIFADIPIFPHSAEIKQSKSFIKFQKKILPPYIAGKTASFIIFLFNKKLFWWCFSLLSLLGIFILLNTTLSSLKNLSPGWILIFYTATLFLHELGHIASCKRFTGRNGEIGFGIYFIFPVLYSNISMVWHASKQERFITNLAGIYMQLWCMLFFYGIFLFTKNESSLYLAYFITLVSFIQIFPFIRSDGYWILSDLTSTSNLLEKSGIEVKSFIKNPVLWTKEKKEKKAFLLCYGLFNNFIFSYFIITQIIYHWKEIIHFPIDILNTIKQILAFQFSEITFQESYITIIIFYMILFNKINDLFKKYSKQPFIGIKKHPIKKMSE
ncbi:putative peptide zinc metalloprotease protein [Chryseobacterium sp. H1D6B]|uniref:hypothetical protein n=1 Tax=Chryseobacterium sp. H1D6B TaxID=2940588 RepID=UPI0015C8B2C1|nr:hypothetical protein [Chryseobacterium sp. H1D6B]MDH6251434.1 putative peptide zinc metalloprotease protein [Chryseobacterium sp. H1D6B]